LYGNPYLQKNLFGLESAEFRKTKLEHLKENIPLLKNESRKDLKLIEPTQTTRLGE